MEIINEYGVGEGKTDEVRRVRHHLHPGDPGGGGGGELSREPLQQDLRRHLQQAVLLSDQTKKIVRDEAGRDHQILRQAQRMQTGKDLLDRYAILSPKVHVQYIDMMKQPQLARAANVTREGEAVIANGRKKEEAKTFDEEGITGAMIRAIKGGARTVYVVTGSGEHRLEDTTAEGISDFQSSRAKRQL